MSDPEQTPSRRDRKAKERDLAAQRRDDSSMSRDEIADHRDEEASHLDAKDDLSDRHTLGVVELRGRGREGRRRAADDRAQAGEDREHADSDREHAGSDREHAGSDREQAGSDREQAARDREEAGTDELTGARRRGVGLKELDNEMKRARRESHSLVAAYVDVDGLKSVNDGQGHAAGDKLLRTVADGFRRHMRPYDLFVRVGGDEFLCALPNVALVEARERFDDLLAELKDSGDISVSIGYTELREGDSADEFVRRADLALLASRKEL